MPKLTLSFKSQILSVHYLEEGDTVIGRDPACDIVIDSLAISPQHAKVLRQQDQCRVTRVSDATAVLLNERAIEDEILQHGDFITIGKHTLTFSADIHSTALPENSLKQATKPSLPESRKETAGAGSEAGSDAYLQVLSGKYIGRIIPLSRKTVRLGQTDNECATITLRDGEHYLSALEGGAPTVNGVAIGKESILLTDGSTIRLGDTDLQFYR
jgi:predicted component of type VI protein secretion system